MHGQWSTGHISSSFLTHKQLAIYSMVCYTQLWTLHFIQLSNLSTISELSNTRLNVFKLSTLKTYLHNIKSKFACLVTTFRTVYSLLMQQYKNKYIKNNTKHPKLNIKCRKYQQ